MTVADALLAISAGDADAAQALAETAAKRAPDSLLAQALAAFLATAHRRGVYEEPASFEQFIDGGANPDLYARTIVYLTGVHAQLQPRAVLDIGCGDGRVTSAVVGPQTEVLDLVEPSEALLREATRQLGPAGAKVSPHAVGIADFLDGLAPAEHWDLVQSTFALHALVPTQRSLVFEALTHRARSLVIVEFDVPRFDDRSGEHAAYVTERYELGVHEYVDEPEVIAGFLMPVLVGQFDPDRPRLTFEQPIDGWVEQLAASGWRTTSTTAIREYWWAPAVCIEAVLVDPV